MKKLLTAFSTFCFTVFPLSAELMQDAKTFRYYSVPAISEARR